LGKTSLASKMASGEKSFDTLREAPTFNVPKEAFLRRYGYSTTGDGYSPEFEYVWTKAQELTDQEALDILRNTLEYHAEDVNFPNDLRTKIQDLLNGQVKFGDHTEGCSLDAKTEAALIYFYSPYPEVRSISDPFDDPNIPVETFRAYLIGFLWAIVGSGVNTFFEPRMPSISLSSAILQILTVPSGKLLSYILPRKVFNVRGRSFTLNPGRWTFKEQMLASIIITSSNGGAYAAIYNIMVQKLGVYYGTKWPTFGFQILLVLSTQFIGFGFAGIMRRLVVYPVRAVWPTILPTIALNRALMVPENKESVHGWRLTRSQFFAIIMASSFVYYWLPGYLFQALSQFNWLAWIGPQNFNLNTICGFNSMGINPVTTFDWNIISTGAPLVAPFYSQMNRYIGTLLAGAILIPAVYYSNYKWTSYLPINSNKLYTNKGEPYNTTMILTDGLFDEKKYEQYSPPFYSAANLVLYGAFFALYPYAIIDTLLDQWRTIKSSFRDLYLGIRNFRRSNFENHHDPYCRMMSEYEEVPDWWFFVVLIISLVLAILCVKLYPTNTPVWGIFFALGINFVFLIPITIILSVTGFSFGLNVLVELIVGYAIPGNGTALMIFKAFGYNIDGQAQNYISDQKMGHYSKLPPRALFKGQIIGCLLQSFVSIAVVNWQILNVKAICTPVQAHMSKFTCPGTNTFFSASVIWGVIGPKLVFSGLYPVLHWCFLIGALLPFPLWAIKRKFPKKLAYFQPVLVIMGLLNYAPYSIAYYTPGLYVGYVFMVYIRHKYLTWWEKYNYVLSSALDAGVALSAIIIFFAVQYQPKNLNWWGNVGAFSNIDNSAQERLPIPSQGYFGPPPGEYPT
jgi:OPT family small oligopeptide transporter